MSLPAVPSLVAGAASWAWNTSLIVALPALLLLALGRWQSFPARARWLVGTALVLRLLLPVVPELPGMNWGPARFLVMPVVRSTEETRTVTQVAASVSTPVRDDSVPGRSPGLPQLLPAGWMIGAITVFAWIGYSHLMIRRRIAGSSQVCADERVHRHLFWAAKRIGVKHPPRMRVMPSLPTVALAGWWRPCILVPPDLCDRFTPGEVRGILLHELAHVRRHDVLWTWLTLAASALHWFNPLVWLLLRRLRVDRELECDRIALALLDTPQRRHFGEALLKTLEAHQWPPIGTVVPFALHQPEIQTRILMITRPPTTRWTRIVALVAAPCLVLLTLANAVADGEKEPGKARDGEGTKKTSGRDGESAKKTGARDGEGGKTSGPRDGESAKKTGVRDGEGSKKASGEGDGAKKGAREAESAKKGTGERASSGTPVVLRVVEQGESVSVGGETMPLNKLRGFLSEYLPAHAKQPVVVEADDTVPYKAVAEVIDAARDNGAKNASLRTSKR